VHDISNTRKKEAKLIVLDVDVKELECEIQLLEAV